MKAIGLKEGMEKALAEHEKHYADIANRKLVRHVDGEGFFFKDGEQSEYGPLADERTNTLFELVDTIYHMREKPWFTSQHLEDFLDLVKRHLGDPRNWHRK